MSVNVQYMSVNVPLCDSTRKQLGVSVMWRGIVAHAACGPGKSALQTYGLVQVILKPDPGNPQELYLGSLEALGIDTRAHDVRPCVQGYDLEFQALPSHSILAISLPLT